jgi:23S rRNA (adenine2503-C2)-methyltransferase
MKILRTIKVPTGHIYIAQGELGKKLEFLSIGDYGKARNVKADFLGLTKEINGVEDGNIMPLSEKWVITTSTQYGCSQGCRFCDVPKVGPGINATLNDLINQVTYVVAMHPEVRNAKRINHHFARMGEPTFNPAVIDAAYKLKLWFMARGWPYHAVVSTMMPKMYRGIATFLERWIDYKNNACNGEAGLQLSINSTDDEQRLQQFGPNSRNLNDISNIMNSIVTKPCLGRKIALNFAVTNSTIIDAQKLADLFDPAIYMCKLTPIHVTKNSEQHSLFTHGGYSLYDVYREHEENLKQAGFDVIVFVPSLEEDKSRITCGNAILADKEK